MEILMWFMFGVAAALAVVGIVRAVERRKAREAHSAEILAESEAASKRPMVEPLPASVGPFVHTGTMRGVRMGPEYSGTAVVPPQVVHHHDSGFNPLLAGAIGYIIGSSGDNHAHAAQVREIEACPPQSDSWHGSDTSSDSSDSCSSSDSGSSSSYDSGSSDSGGGSSSD